MTLKKIVSHPDSWNLQTLPYVEKRVLANIIKDMEMRSSWTIRESRSVVSDSLRPHGLYSSWNFPGQNTGVGSLSLLQWIVLTPGIELGSPALQADSLPTELPGKPLDYVRGP